ncbi:MAG: Hsp20/alpha crystallin family protein [Deltaproteobacteria bacterium]|nr:Hsp20/alpha crystallin family protein [Deltaproteobacteria bacterium]
MAIVKWDPFKDMITLRDRMDRLFEDSLARLRGGEDDMGHSAWAPAVDIYETADTLVIKAEIPGVEKEDISVEVKENALYLKGERKFEKEVKEENYHRMERSYGSFKRIFQLPTSVDEDKIKANFKDGVLEINIPKAEETKTKQINVDVD